jgi:hypothetical protein
MENIIMETIKRIYSKEKDSLSIKIWIIIGDNGIAVWLMAMVNISIIKE